jgi:hypothetical protein
MSQVIIYNQDNGNVAVVFPSPEALEQYGIMAIALKDVPAGKPFAIIDAADLPTAVPQEAWTVDETDLTDGVGAEYDVFPEVQP